MNCKDLEYCTTMEITSLLPFDGKLYFKSCALNDVYDKTGPYFHENNIVVLLNYEVTYATKQVDSE